MSETYGPDIVQRYNGYRSADINGGPAPGFSSGEAQAAISEILDETLPNGMTYEWTDLAYQQSVAGNSAVYISRCACCSCSSCSPRSTRA